MTITQQLADIALGFQYDTIPAEARDVSKRLIVDALACGIGGYHSETGRIVRDFAAEYGPRPEASLIGTNLRVSCSAAIIANQAMLRYLDYNDDLPIAVGPGNLVAAHPSGALPVAFAVAERVGASGAQLIETMVAGYEVIGRLLAGFKTSLEVRGVHHGSVLPYAGCAMAGRLLGLKSSEIAHAMGIAGSLTVGLDILDAEGEEYTMTKNLADGMLSERGYAAAQMAKRGLTGPERIIEGHKGFAEVLLGGTNMFVWAAERRGEPWILNAVIKGMCAEATTHGHLQATTSLVREHKLVPEDIALISIRTNQRSVYHTGDPVKKYPRNKETADHSAYFLTAMAVIQGKITPRIYAQANFTDPTVIGLIEKIALVHGPEYDAIVPAAEVTIELRNGSRLVRRVDKDDLVGEPTNRMSDARLRAKFVECTEGIMTPSEVDRIIEQCLSLEKLDRVEDLMKLTRIATKDPLAKEHA
jgi:2-methylcitrate dehydratase